MRKLKITDLTYNLKPGLDAASVLAQLAERRDDIEHVIEIPAGNTLYSGSVALPHVRLVVRFVGGNILALDNEAANLATSPNGILTKLNKQISHFAPGMLGTMYIVPST